MPKQPPPLRRAPKSRRSPGPRGAPPIVELRAPGRTAPKPDGRSGGANGDEIDPAKIIKRFVRWLNEAGPKRQQLFIHRFIDGIQAMEPCDALEVLKVTKLVVKSVGPVTKAHSAVCNKRGPCDTCESETISFPNSSNVCCVRGPDDHNVIFN